ncbi:unnamed protein product [Psylliodes chrysocephalus]|uniref:HAT C-terminal dimerisation domain-containing protein n=1 Tax=Psylliodes chrysocephalus TaxID=3402493 RepID=A0A9P0D9Y6_9CUCU|nr:unnamed protein product [Psylliodes chrysocephala]
MKTEKQVVENRAKIKPIIEAVLVCGREEMSLRGHQDYGELKIDDSSVKEGKFRAILKYRAKGDAELRETLEQSSFMYLLMGEKTVTDCDVYDELLDLYMPDVPKVILKTEIKLWHNYLNNHPDIKSKRQALAHLELCNQQAYPNVYKLLLIFCAIPVSTATPERTFSTLKIIRTYL